MSKSDFIKHKALTIVVNLMGMVIFIYALLSIGVRGANILKLILMWFIILIIYYAMQYITRKRYFSKLISIANGLDKKYLISEIIEEPKYFDSIPYYTLLKIANKSMLEEITRVRNERIEYREYIERWIHEVKNPIASVKLVCENNKSDITRIVLMELAKIDNYVEQALFYARSEYVEKDYLIKEFRLKGCINNVIVKNKHLLISNKVDVNLLDLDQTVYSDEKWVEFIINQLVINAVKYRKNKSPKIKIYSKTVNNGVRLVIEDNGIGIEDSDLTRVFDKGFTGNNGRDIEKSTGIGLYVSKKLCKKLGLTITIESKKNYYTKVCILFPKGTFIKV
ncbi:sensor histidine kinase [Clostridiaceae bacterium M8S5]|nr:sensor histidine kinase [Clostridiaceae bacterium M8S5]